MIRLATVFSGIGAPEHALKRMGAAHEIVFACDNGDRAVTVSKDDAARLHALKDNATREKEVRRLYAAVSRPDRIKETYFRNYGLTDDRWFTDVRFLDGRAFRGRVDLFVGGSPCQSFSLMGRRKGFADERGSLFHEYIRLVREIRPAVFVFENVPGIMSNGNGGTWKQVRDEFASLGYDCRHEVLNAADFDVPQIRKRLFVVGFREKPGKPFAFPEPLPSVRRMADFLERNVAPKYYLGKKGFAFVTGPGHAGRARIGRDVMRTQKRNQQFNWNGDFVFEKTEAVKDNDVLNKAHVGFFHGEAGVIRKLTPRECHRLMGFGDDFVICDNDVDAYRQAGNAIVVDVLIHLFTSIIETGVFDD